MKNEYDLQAENFAKKFDVTLHVDSYPSYELYFEDDKEERYVFDVMLTRNGDSFSFTFGQSISAGAQEPTLYEVLSCLTKTDPGTFEEFCSEFGYSEDNLASERIYNNVVEEYENVMRLFSDCIEELQEIN